MVEKTSALVTLRAAAERRREPFSSGIPEQSIGLTDIQHDNRITFTTTFCCSALNFFFVFVSGVKSRLGVLCATGQRARS